MAQANQVTRAENAGKLSTRKIAGEIISAIKVVRLSDPDTVFLSDKDLFNTAQSLGVAITAATVGNLTTILTLGILEDASLTFTLNDPLYLGDDGTITDVAPVTGHRVRIGYSLGAGSIFVQIEEPIIL